MESTPRVVIPENGTKSKSRPPHEKGAVKIERYPNGKKKWKFLSQEQREKKMEYQRKYAQRKAMEAKKARLPYPFKHCPECATKLPVVEHKGRAYPIPCFFCLTCGYEIPIMPKAGRGGARSQ